MVFRILNKRPRPILRPFLKSTHIFCLSQKIFSRILILKTSYSDSNTIFGKYSIFLVCQKKIVSRTLIKRPTVILTRFLESTQILYDESIVCNFLVKTIRCLKPFYCRFLSKKFF